MGKSCEYVHFTLENCNSEKRDICNDNKTKCTNDNLDTGQKVGCPDHGN